MKKSELELGAKVQGYKGGKVYEISYIEEDIVGIWTKGEPTKEVKVANLVKNYKRVGDPEPKEEVKPDTKKKEVKPDTKKQPKKQPKKPATTEPRELPPEDGDIMTLKDVVDSMIEEGILPESMIKEGKPNMKKIRRKLRGDKAKVDKGLHLRELSIDKFRWEWASEYYNDVAGELVIVLQ